MQWVFLTFIYPGKGFLLNTLSLLSSNTLLLHSALIHTFTPGSCPLQEQSRFGAVAAPRASLKGLFLSPLAYKHPSLVSSWVFHSNVCLFFPRKTQTRCSFNLHFHFDFGVCTFCTNLEQPDISSVVLKVSTLPEWACLASLSNFWLASTLKAQILSALNLTGGILFLEQHKLVWERGRGKDSVKGFENHWLTSLETICVRVCVCKREREIEVITEVGRLPVNATIKFT